MIVRDAQEADLPQIIDIYNATIPGRMVTADTEPVTLESRLPWFYAHTPDRRPLWIISSAESDITGWISFGDFYGRSAYRFTAEISIYLKTPARQRGLGTQLLTMAINKAPALGIENIVGYIFAHNEPSLRLFKKAGFEEWGYLKDVAVLDGIKRSLIIVGKNL